MSFVDRLERRLGWIAFPGILRCYAILHVLVFILQFFRPDDLGQLLDFDRTKIMQGEVWRLVTFLFASSAVRGTGVMAAVFILFFVQIVFLISDSLEGVWGVFRATLFFYTGIFLLILGVWFMPAAPAFAGSFLYSTAFLAFATYFPKVEFLLFFILPVQVRFFAWLSVVMTLFLAFTSPITIPFLLLAHANYLLFVGIPWLRGHRKVVEAAVRRREMQTQTSKQSFHRCHVCGRTELDDAHLEFRVGNDGEEYCQDHLPPL